MIYMDNPPEDASNDVDLAKTLETILDNLKKDTNLHKSVKLDMNDFEFKDTKYKKMQKKHTNYYSALPDPEKLVMSQSEQINSLWQEIKNLQANIDHLIKLISIQGEELGLLKEKINSNKNNDKFEEIDDRLADMESRIDLLDE